MTKPEVFIFVQGGVVQEVLSPLELKVTVIDRDVQGCGMVSVVELEPADIQEPSCRVDPERYETVMRDMKKGLVDFF